MDAVACAAPSKRKLEEAFPAGCSQSSGDDDTDFALDGGGGERPEGSGPVTWLEVEECVPTREAASSAGHASCVGFAAYAGHVRTQHRRMASLFSRLPDDQRLVGQEEVNRPAGWSVESPPFQHLDRVYPTDSSASAHRDAMRRALDTIVPDAVLVGRAAGNAAGNGVHAWRAYLDMAARQVNAVFRDPPPVRGGVTDPLWVQARVTEAVEAALAMHML